MTSCWKGCSKVVSEGGLGKLEKIVLFHDIVVILAAPSWRLWACDGMGRWCRDVMWGGRSTSACLEIF